MDNQIQNGAALLQPRLVRRWEKFRVDGDSPLDPKYEYRYWHEGRWIKGQCPSRHPRFEWGIRKPITETMNTFYVWTFAGCRYLAVPRDNGFHIVDENGNNFGSWMTVEKFKKRQRSNDPESWSPLGRASLRVSPNARDEA